MSDITIPDVALEAGARASWNEQRRQAAISGRPGAGRMPSWDELGPLRQTHLIAETRAACLAMLRAWPGMRVSMLFPPNEPHVVLPLTENPDAEA